MPSSYGIHSTDWIRPAQGAMVIVPGPAAFYHTLRGIYVGTAGDVTVTLPSGESVQFKNLAAGVIHPIAATRITAATAADIIGIY